MSQFKRLLLIADPVAESSSALQRAAALAEASGAALHMVVFGGNATTPWRLGERYLVQLRTDFVQQQKARLEVEAERLRAKGIEVTTEAVWNDAPLADILQRVRDLHADLLIKDSNHEPALRRVFVTPLDWQLLRECPVPMHLVSFAEHPLPRRIVAAVDLSQPEELIGGMNERIVAAAGALARQCKAELHLLHAHERSAAYMAYAVAPLGWSDEMQEDLERELRDSFDELAEQGGIPQKQRHIVIGSPVRAIADFVAHNRMDVVVMGTLSHKGLEKILGSTSEQTLYRIPSSIMTIRPTTAV
ncbi:Universal stress protein E [compost metagenome]